MLRLVVPENPWIRTVRPARTGPFRRLVCFSDAGGAASAFRVWCDHFADDVEVLAVELPGRGRRELEAPEDRIATLVEEIQRALRPHLGGPIVFFGQGTGAVLAFEVAQRTQAYGRGSQHLVVAPRRVELSIPPNAAQDEKVCRSLEERGLVPSGLLRDPELRRLCLPAIVADLRAVAGWRPTVQVGFPLTVLARRGDRDVDSWRTASSVLVDVLPVGRQPREDDSVVRPLPCAAPTGAWLVPASTLVEVLEDALEPIEIAHY